GHTWPDQPTPLLPPSVAKGPGSLPPRNPRQRKDRLRMVGAILGDVLAWLLFIGITVVGVALTAVGTVRAHRLSQRRGMGALSATVFVVVTAIVLFLGGWIVFGLAVGATKLWRISNKSTTAR